MTDLNTNTDDPDPYRDTGKTCLGGGMHCPSASSFNMQQPDDLDIVAWCMRMWSENRLCLG